MIFLFYVCGSSPGDTWNTESGAHQVFTKLSSTMTEIFSEKDMNVQGKRVAYFTKSGFSFGFYVRTYSNSVLLKTGQQAVTSFQSRTKSMKIISPGSHTT